MMKKSMCNFIKTENIEIKQRLLKSGFTLLSEDGGVFCFINNGKMNFSEEEKKKLVFTNLLAI